MTLRRAWWWLPSRSDGCVDIGTYCDAVFRRLTHSKGRSKDVLEGSNRVLRCAAHGASPALTLDLAHITEVEQLDDVIASQETEERRRQALMIEYEYLAYTGEPVPAVVTEKMTRMVKACGRGSRLTRCSVVPKRFMEKDGGKN